MYCYLIDAEDMLVINNENRRVEFTIEIVDDEILEPFEFLTAEFVITYTSGETYSYDGHHLIYIEDNDCKFKEFLGVFKRCK